MPTFIPSIWLPALLAGLLSMGALWFIARMLSRTPLLRGLAFPYALGTITLGVAVIVALLTQRLGVPLYPIVQHLLLALLFFCWGYVALEIVENMLLANWTRRNLTPIPRLVRDIARAAIVIAALLLAIQFILEIPLDSIIISSTVLSAVIGLALQDLLKDVIAGVALQLESPFLVGHWLQIGDDVGRVVEMSWRATRLITVDGNLIIFPNAMLGTARLINYSAPEPLQAMHTQIALGHDYQPNLVKQALVAAMLATPDVAPEPLPSVKVIAYGEYSVTYDLKFWLHNYDRYPEKRDAVMTAAWYALRRAGLSLPIPRREVAMQQVDHAARAAAQADTVATVLEDLRHVDVLRILSEEELGTLALLIQTQLYARGEVLVRQGDAGSALFIIRSGRVRVDVRGDDGTTVTVNHLGPGEFFGELSLLTGAPRGASVIADADTSTLVVEQMALAPILQANSALPELLGDILAQRLQMNAATLTNRRADAFATDEISRPSLVGRIRHLFGL